MPIMWRYLLNQYLKVFLFCVLTFLAVLLTTRLDEIAHFATLGPEGALIFWYVMYQIPYILPIAIPLSCLIAAMIVMQSLSNSHELTALRSAGLSIKRIIAPLLVTSCFLSFINFYVISEVATHSHMSASLLKNELRSLNPLLLLNNRHLMRMKGYYFDTFGSSKMGETASYAILASPNNSNSRINLLVADLLAATPDLFYGKNISIITDITPKTLNKNDNIIIENMSGAMTSIQDFTKLIEKKVWHLNNDHLRLPLLLLRLESERAEYKALSKSEKVKPETWQILKNIRRCISEIQKRISVGLAPFTFTLLGAAFGISITRNKTNSALFSVLGLSALYLICFFSGKGAEHVVWRSSMFYFAPHVLIIGASLIRLQRLAYGRT
ncbi:MAG: LptF/LptG family permease [Chlamydiota bacterium]|nr:LptF/LptG family permease [Chlamydiota bacterium]